MVNGILLVDPAELMETIKATNSPAPKLLPVCNKAIGKIQRHFILAMMNGQLR